MVVFYLAEQWAGDTSLDDYKVSPINGDLDGLGRITLTVGTKKCCILMH